MRLRTVIAFLGAFVAAVHAQNPLEALAAHMPKCAVCLLLRKSELISRLT